MDLELAGAALGGATELAQQLPRRLAAAVALTAQERLKALLPQRPTTGLFATYAPSGHTLRRGFGGTAQLAERKIAYRRAWAVGGEFAGRTRLPVVRQSSKASPRLPSGDCKCSQRLAVHESMSQVWLCLARVWLCLGSRQLLCGCRRVIGDCVLTLLLEFDLPTGGAVQVEAEPLSSGPVTRGGFGGDEAVIAAEALDVAFGRRSSVLAGIGGQSRPASGSADGVELVLAVKVGRSRLRPSDCLTVADQPLRVD